MQGIFLTVVCAVASTLLEVLGNVLVSTFTWDSIILRDFSAHVGNDSKTWRGGAEYQGVGMRISISKSAALVLCWERVECPLQVGEELLPQVEEFK